MVEKEKALKCCVHAWRIVFIVLNSIFLVIGLVLVGLSIYLLATQNDLTVITGNRIASGAVLILIAGLITSVISFIGVLGAVGMWSVLLIVYIALLFVIVLLEIVAGILGFVYRTSLVEASAERASDAIIQYRLEEDPEFKEDVNFIVDFLQGEFDCCGYTGVSDWLDTDYLNDTGGRFPDSCNCTEPPEMMTGQPCGEVNSQFIYTAPCNGSFSDFLSNNLIIVGGVGIAFGIFELLGLAVAISLTCCFCYIKKHKDDYEFTKAV